VSGDGFTLGLLNGIGEVRALFDLLDSESTVKFLSAPQLMVIDNQTATIRVGDQIPIVTRSSTSTTDPDAPIVTEVQFRDTGTLMTVTPRIKDGGMVTLEVSQEVSIPGTTPAVGGGGNVPISQRTVESTVLVHSGQTVILGGLIRENNTMSKAGVPVLQFLPVVGNLFGSTTKDIERTELLVTLRPRVIDNPQDALDVTKEIRKRMRRATAVEAALGQPQELPARRW
ncbi:MAG: type II secretion system protein GspD, partial [Candidatus Sedimenticola sp. 6PFRAG5]